MKGDGAPEIYKGGFGRAEIIHSNLDELIESRNHICESSCNFVPALITANGQPSDPVSTS
jgi:hypothetical protein